MLVKVCRIEMKFIIHLIMTYLSYFIQLLHTFIKHFSFIKSCVKHAQ